MTIRLIRVPFLIPNWAAAQVLFPRTVFYKRGALTAYVLAHEIGHVMQIEHLGLFRYWLTYLTSLIRSGYDGNVLEDDAERRVPEFLKCAQVAVRRRVKDVWYQKLKLW